MRWWADFSYTNCNIFHPPPDIERRVSTLAQQCVNVKKDALQFVINDREFKETAIQWGYDK